jgi:hypothetical protein
LAAGTGMVAAWVMAVAPGAPTKGELGNLIFSK